MKRRTFWIGWLVALGLALAGCHTTTGTTASATVTLNATTVTVAVSSSFQFAASVTGPTVTTVTWEVNSVTGGNSKVGTIDTTGLYSAPSTVPNPNTVTVTAISTAVPTVSASATVTIDSGIRVTVSPSLATMGTLETLPFSAAVTGTSNTAVTWQVCQANTAISSSPCTADTTGNLGTIDVHGNYTGPSAVPASNPVSIQAASVADPNQISFASITLSSATDPTVASIYPTQIAQGALFVDVYLAGANFLTTTQVFLPTANPPTTLPASSFGGGVLRVRVLASFLSSAPGVIPLQVRRQGGSAVSCSPTPAACQLTVVAERPAIVAASPNSELQGLTNPTAFNVNGGSFGTSSVGASVTPEFNGNTAGGAISPRQAAVTITPADLAVPGLYQVSLTNPSVTTPVGAPQTTATTNFAVQSCLGSAQGCTDPSSAGFQTLAVGTHPMSIAVNTATGIAIIANHDSNDLTLVDLTGPAPIIAPGGASIPVGKGPTGVAVDNLRNLAVVANNTDKTISVVNLATKAATVVSTQIPAAPYSVGVNPITGIALIAYQSTNIGALVDLTQNPPVFVGAVTLGSGAKPQVAVLPSLNWGMVTPGGAGSFSIVDLARRSSNTITSKGAVRVSSTTTVTITTTAPHGLTVGDAVLVTGVSDTTFNGVFAVTSVPSSTSFTYTQTGADSTSGGGEIFYSEPLATAAFGENVTGISVNPEAKRAVLTDATNVSSVLTMSVLDQAVTPISLETGTSASAVNPYTDIAVAVNPLTNTLSVIDPRTPLRLTTLPLSGTTPSAVAIDPGTNQVIVVNQGSNNLTFITLGAIKPLHLESVILPINRQLGTDLTLSSSTDLPLTLIGKGFTSSSVVRLDGIVLSPVGAVTDRTMSVIVPASMLANARRYAVDVLTPGSGVSNVEYFSVVKAVELTTAGCASPAPSAVAVDDLRNLAIVTETQCSSVALVDIAAGAVTKTIAVGNNPQGVATAPGFGLAAVTNRGDNTVTILDIADTTQAPVTLNVGGEPIGVAISPLDGTTLVANSNTNSNSVTSFLITQGANATFSQTAVGAQPVAVAIDPIDQLALVANAGNETVTLLDISATPPGVRGTSSVFSLPTGVAFDPFSSPTTPSPQFIVAASLDNSLVFINPTTNLSTTARIGINPTSVAFNYLTNTAVTVNSGSGTVSVMDVTTRRTSSNLALKGAFLGSVAIVPNTNLCLIVDQVNNRLLIVPLPN